MKVHRVISPIDFGFEILDLLMFSTFKNTVGLSEVFATDFSLLSINLGYS